MADHPAPRTITDVAVLRLLAHPLRRRIEEQLRGGPVTATTLAQALGESSGLTSYHLRQLAKHGFIEEVPELATGKERWWRAVPGDRRWPPYTEQTPEMREASAEMSRNNLAELVELYERFERQAPELGAWADAFLFSRATIRVDLSRLREFFEEYIRLVQRYGADDAAEEPKTVLLRLFSFPEA
ncbi:MULTISPECIES: transcriptional regulator [unclassified Nocardia]|uniref:ArsR/SmtB family transcription factor n=1 Tax=unclassified Nocardia TaxID=2637762 RepID=UPI001CE46941|nr:MULTISPECIES: helix-turn-helix domain-containing protein [unclassified Nocardia]